MSRRSDHTREELAELIIREGHRQLSEVGFARFSAREVAKRIGYSIGTLYNVFGDYDHLMLAINGRTLDLWRAALVARLADARSEGEQAVDRLSQAISVYFDFAVAHRHAWTALYDFRLPQDEPPPPAYAEKVAAITHIVVREVTAALPAERKAEGPALSRSLLAMVHGHCFFALNGTFKLLGETDPLGAALARLREAIHGEGIHDETTGAETRNSEANNGARDNDAPRSRRAKAESPRRVVRATRVAASAAKKATHRQ